MVRCMACGTDCDEQYTIQINGVEAPICEECDFELDATRVAELLRHGRLCGRVAGASPHVQPGSVVKVIRLVDPEGDTDRVGHVGRVEFLDYDAGVGESYPTDPYVIVRFEDGNHDGFWSEELGKPEDIAERRPKVKLLVTGARVE